MNISNSLSILRIILAFPVAFFIYTDKMTIGIIIGIIAGITDFLDGFLARKLNQITELGKIIDPIADKIFVGLLAFVMIFVDLLPLWFFLAVIIRDLLILAGGLYLTKKYKIVLQSNFEGKATFFLILLTILGVLLKIENVAFYGYYLCSAALVYSFATYLIRMIEVMKENTRF